MARTIKVVAAVALIGLVPGCGGDDDTSSNPATPDQTITVTAYDYRFASDVVPEITTGETVRFVLDNEGALEHDMQLLDPDGRRLGAVEAQRTGGGGQFTVTFDAPGTYRLICDVDDHLTVHDMQAVFEVTDG